MNKNRILTIALAKGRLADQTLDVLARCGLDLDWDEISDRQLIFENKSQTLRFFLAKPSDIPTYVEYGAADIGFVGKDTLLEEQRSVYELLDLGLGRCRLCVCGPEALAERWDRLPNKRVGTKYPEVAKTYFAEEKRETVEIIRLNGSVELAPLLDLADVIVDIVESGRTLEANHLVVLETIADISARMIVNRVSRQMKADLIGDLVGRIRKVVEEK